MNRNGHEKQWSWAKSRRSLGATERFSGGHEQRSLLGSFAEALTSNAKSKCHGIKCLPVKIKFVVFIIAS